jgi:hypothetical protein
VRALHVDCVCQMSLGAEKSFGSDK